jgi:hypothetical protein
MITPQIGFGKQSIAPGRYFPPKSKKTALFAGFCRMEGVETRDGITEKSAVSRQKNRYPHYARPIKVRSSAFGLKKIEQTLPERDRSQQNIFTAKT